MASFRIALTLSLSSVAMDLVTASRNRYARDGSVSMLPLVAFLTTEAMNLCCRWMRSRSDPSPSPYRVRT